MVKAAIAVEMPAAEVARLCVQFGYGDGSPTSVRATQLFGGYSGLTYRIDETLPRGEEGAPAAESRVAVLKVCRGYPEAEVRAQAAVQGLLGVRGFTGSCTALPLLAGRAHAADPSFVTLSASGEPVVMLTFVAGTPADAVIEAGADAVDVLRAVGAGLAALHLVRAGADGERSIRSIHEGGACLVGSHAAGALLAEMEASEHTRAHPFVTFYRARLPALRAALASSGALPCGILHGDPFLDNILVTLDVTGDGVTRDGVAGDGARSGGAALTAAATVSGAVSGRMRGARGAAGAPAAGAPAAAGSVRPSVSGVAFVDFEDATFGPLVFDVACAASAACFVHAGAGAGADAGSGAGADGAGAGGDAGGVLDAGRLAAFLLGYAAVRPLNAAERAVLADWLRATLLCNAAWRFVNFQIKRRDSPAAARESYRELEARVRTMEDGSALAMVHALLNALPVGAEETAELRASARRPRKPPAPAVSAGGGKPTSPPPGEGQAAAPPSSWFGMGPELEQHLPALAAATAAVGFALGALLRTSAGRPKR
jgi:Ser/Thr protein kinase RdoA (MazF antagonist)